MRVNARYINFTRGASSSCIYTHARWLGSLLSCMCDVFRVLINSLVCWFCTSTLGLVLFKICSHYTACSRITWSICFCHCNSMKNRRGYACLVVHPVTPPPPPPTLLRFVFLFLLYSVPRIHEFDGEKYETAKSALIQNDCETCKWCLRVMSLGDNLSVWMKNTSVYYYYLVLTLCTKKVQALYLSNHYVHVCHSKCSNSDCFVCSQQQLGFFFFFFLNY